MRTSRRRLLIAAGLSVIGLAISVSARSPSRKSREWSQDVHVVTPAAIVDRVHTSGAPVLVVIFAGWCEECRREIPALDRALGAFGGTDLRVIAVAIDEDADSYEPFATPHVTLDPERLAPGEQKALVGAIRSLGGTYHRSVPYAALFDRRGLLVRDLWDEGHRVEEIAYAVSSLTSKSAALR